MIHDIAGMTELCELEMVGNGMFWELLKDAGYRTVADLRAIKPGDAQLEFMRAVQAAVDRLKAASSASVDWALLARKACRLQYKIQSAPTSDSGDVPKPFQCNIMLTWMTDPVISPAGISYDRANIEQWLLVYKSEPFTREALESAQLVPNRALKDAIDMYRPLEQNYRIDHTPILSRQPGCLI
jgi:hypothetical protein